MKITNKEYNQIIEEMSMRLIDMAYLKSKETVREAFPKKVLETFLGKEDTVTINYGIELLVNDLYQILGRIRREGKKEGRRKIC